MNELKEGVAQWLKMEGLNEITIAVILKYMEKAYLIGETDGLDTGSKIVHEVLNQN